MFEILQHFERTAAHFEPIVLVLPGVIFLALGLIVWLAGLRYARLIAAACGAIAAGVGSRLAGVKTSVATVLAIPGALIAILFREMVLGVVTVAVVVAVAVAVIAPSQTGRAKTSMPLLQYYLTDEQIGTSDAILLMKTYINYLATEARSTCSELAIWRWAVVTGAAAAAVVLAIFLYRFVIAVCFSCLGSGLCFVGMTGLLLYKGSQPITYISTNGLYYAGVFVVMTAIGACSQFLLCRAPAKKKDTKSQDEQGPSIGAYKSWRTG